MRKKQKSFQLLILVAVNLAMLILLSDFCTLRSYAINLGASGERIASLQKSLKEAGYYSGEINGIYDFTTRKAVKDFRKENGISDDKPTDFEIFSSLGIDTKSFNGCFSSDIELLAKHLKANGIIEYHDMVNTCESIIRNTGNDSLCVYIISETDDIKSLIDAEPNSRHYTAAFQAVRRLKN